MAFELFDQYSSRPVKNLIVVRAFNQYKIKKSILETKKERYA